MAAHYEKREGDIWAGVIGLRAPDGSITKTVRFYAPAPDGDTVKPAKLTDSEKDVCDGIVREMAGMFGQYVENAKALDTVCT